MDLLEALIAKKEHRGEGKISKENTYNLLFMLVILRLAVLLESLSTSLGLTSQIFLRKVTMLVKMDLILTLRIAMMKMK